MELKTIKSQLTYYTGKFPKEAVRAAIQQPDLINPDLLTSLEKVADDPDILSNSNYMLPTYAFYLLAQFQEERAYPLIVKIFSYPGEFILDATGDFVTEDLGRVLASVCGDDITPIKNMIEDESLNEYVRSAGLSAIVVLVAENKIKREEAIAYFTTLFRGRFKKEENEVWSSLVYSCCDLGPDELIFDIKQAFSENLVDSQVIGFDEVQKHVSKKPEYIISKHPRRFSFIGNAIDEMSWWAAFDEKENIPKSKKVGRNDPCPCGSGSKYKRCCLNFKHHPKVLKP